MGEGDQVVGVGPPPELTSLLRAEYPRLLGSLSLMVGSRHIAEELAQETCVRACQHWDDVSMMRAPGGWLHRVAFNLAISSIRRSKSEGRALGILANSERLVDEPASAVDDETTIRRALRDLSIDERAVVVARYFLAYSVSETAEALSISQGTVKTRTRRALSKLRSCDLVMEADSA